VTSARGAHETAEESAAPGHAEDGAQKPELDAAAALLAASPDFLVLRRLAPPARYTDDDGALTRRAFFVDVETTGLEAQDEAIIQFCGVPFDYAPATGRIHRLYPAIVGYEDPGRAIPPFIVEKTGITDAMVAGQRLDEGAIRSALDECVLVIAHNASFDRPFLERRIPLFADRHWACSMSDVPWGAMGIDSPKLEFLLYKHARVFYDAHRADEDSYAGIHLLATTFPDGELPMRLLLETARRPICRLEATQAPIERKELLKVRGYRWNRARSVWWRDVSDDARDAEVAWLREAVYLRADATPHLERVDLKRRFADRA
jgi:DNA polymerase-3 subunit epsilon